MKPIYNFYDTKNKEIITYVLIENEDKIKSLLMNLAKKNNLTIIKYYWISKYDNSIIELFEPKIVDVYLFSITLSGNIDDTRKCINQFNQRYKLEMLV